MPDPAPFPHLKTPWADSSTSAAGQASESPPIPIPDHTLIRRIGKGSYGEVWLARSALGVYRAVKIVHRRAFDDDRPFERELAGIQRFEPISRTHESQINILHVGRGTDCFYYVMELADDASGDLPSPDTYTPRTLRSELLFRGRLPIDECLRLGLALTTALEHLHRHGLVHRDIKPSNIVFVHGIPKLADIGLVAHAEGTKSFVGTEGYLPPEGPGTRQADVFSLGKVLYEISTGRDRQQFPELPTNVTELPDRAELAEFNEVLLRACAPDVRHRYESAAEMHADLALLQSGKSVARVRATERRLKFAARAAALVTAIAVLAGAAFLYQQAQTRKARELASRNRQLAEEKTTLASEKTKLADNLNRLAEENRQRIVRLDIANGIRLLDEGDPSGALLWFSDALPLLATNPAEESIHRIRIQQTLDQTPRVMRVFPHDSAVSSGAFSPDGRLIATGTKNGSLRVWNAAEGTPVWGPKQMGAAIFYLRFSRDGKRLFASSSWEQGLVNGYQPKSTLLAVVEAKSGREVFATNAAWPGISTNVLCGHFSPDDRWLALSEKSGVIRLFNLENGRQVNELKGHTDDVTFLSFSADGSLLASASLDRTVRLWCLPSGEPVGPPLEHRWPVVRALLTEDGKHLVTLSFPKPGASGLGEDGQSEVQAWDVTTSRHLGDPIPTGGWVAMLVAPGRQGGFFVDGVKGEEGVQSYHFDPPGKPVAATNIFGGLHSWDFSQDGSRMALGGGDLLARVFDAQKGTPLAEPIRHPRPMIMVTQFSRSERLLLTACDDGNARLWDLRRSPPGSLSRSLPAPMQRLRPEDFRSEVGLGRLPERTPIFLADLSLRLFGERLEELHRFHKPQPDTTFRDIASGWQSNVWASQRYTPDSKAIFLWRPEGEETRGFILEHPAEAYRYFFTHDDRLLVTYCRDRVVRFWRTSDGRLERKVDLPEATKGTIVELSPDGRTAGWLRVTEDGLPSFQFLDLESGEIIGDTRTLLSTVFESVFSPDGKRIALLDNIGQVTVLESRTGRVISSTISHSSNLIWVEWDPDGHRLLTAGHDDQVLVWDADTGTQLLGALRTPGGTIRVARWSPDGRFIIARNDNKQVRVWDAATGEAVTPPLKHSGDVAFAFMTRTHRVISASYPDMLRAWDFKETALSSSVLTDYAKLLSGRRLSAAGTMLVLKPEELAELNRSLKQSAPQLFE